ncbi:MAG: hypothetical protein AN486_07350 [Anabaena sp. AL93]|nr:MAG: hypothetical protein AN486_07350 [Anabaena sp. AL93]
MERLYILFWRCLLYNRSGITIEYNILKMVLCNQLKTLQIPSKGLPIKKIPKNFLWCGAKSPLIIKDGQDAHPTKLGNLFFGVP